MKRELLFYGEQCTGCGICVKNCPNGVHEIRNTDSGFLHTLNRENCILCGACAARCPAEALEMAGEELEAEETVQRLLRDRAFYRNSGGGITLSGGEPLLQFAFTKEVLLRCREEGLHTCLDTSGFGISPDQMKQLVLDGLVDLFLYDLKETEEERHRTVTGVPLAPILMNLKAVGDAGGNIRLRCPIVPGVNDREEHVKRIGEIAEEVRGILAIDLIPYHHLGLVKAEALGEKQQKFELLTEERKQELLHVLKQTCEAECGWM